MIGEPSMIDLMSEKEVRMACKELSIDVERKRKRIEELEASVKYLKSISIGNYLKQEDE